MTWGKKKKKSKPWGEATWQAQTGTGATPPPKETTAMVREGEMGIARPATSGGRRRRRRTRRRRRRKSRRRRRKSRRRRRKSRRRRR